MIANVVVDEYYRYTGGSTKLVHLTHAVVVKKGEEDMISSIT